MTLALDSSALIAIFNEEPEKQAFFEALYSEPVVAGWPTIFEVRLWLVRRQRDDAALLKELLARSNVSLVAFDAELETLASQAYRRFGKGIHPAALNFGDCMAYAVARWHDAPLLFKGADFGRTDIGVHPASVAA